MMSFFNYKKGSKKGYMEREENFYYEIVPKVCWTSLLYTTADINCRLKIKSKDESREVDFFTSTDDLKDHLEGLV